MVPNPNGFFDNLEELPAHELKKGCSISFLSKRERLANQLRRLEERQQKLEVLKLKKAADLELISDDEDDFRVKISQKDFEILKRAKLQEQELNQEFNLVGLNQQHEAVVVQRGRQQASRSDEDQQQEQMINVDPRQNVLMLSEPISKIELSPSRRSTRRKTP